MAGRGPGGSKFSAEHSLVNQMKITKLNFFSFYSFKCDSQFIDNLLQLLTIH